MSKKLLSCIMVFALLFTAIGSFTVSSPVIASAAASLSDKQFASDGLVARYDGNLNQRTGHSLGATTWHDLSGNGYDIDLSGKSSSYFSDYAFVLDHEIFYLNDALLDTVNSDEYTLEVAIGDLSAIGNTFTTFINSTGNDNFSLFIRTGTNVLEFKSSASNSRPTSVEGREYSTYHTVAVTFVANTSVKLYVDGVCVGEATPSELSGAVGPLALGSSNSTKTHKAEYRGIRVYNRALSSDELASNASSDKITYITSSSKAIPLTLNVPYPTSNIYSFLNGFTYTLGSECVFTTASSDLVIENGYITATSAGIYDLTIYDGTNYMDIKAVVKEPTSIEHVIYTDDFNGSLKEGYCFLGTGSYSLSSTHLIVNSSGQSMTRFFLPAEVSFFGDYNILVNAIFQQVDNSARWMSVMFRGNGHNPTPYYQMCLRQAASASNGVEFAMRNEADTDWSVFNTAAAADNAIGSNVQLRVKTSGNSVREFVNTSLIIDTTVSSGRSTGSVGFGANQATVAFDNITVSLNCGRAPTLGYVDVAQPDTNVIGGITLTDRVESAEKMNSLASATVKPANAIFYVDSALNIYDSEYKTSFGTVSDAVASLNMSIMPTFYVRDNETVDALSSYLASLSYTDVFFMSPTDSVLLYAKSRYTLARRVLDVTPEYKNATAALSAETLMDIRTRAQKAWASTVVLPSNCTSLDAVVYLQDKVMTVWIQEVEALASHVTAFDLLSQGPYGIISDNSELVYEVTEKYMTQNTMLRSPLNVGHRGSPGKAADNTIEGCRIAYEDGAEVIELDIYLTADNHIVCSHDQWTGPYYTKNYDVEAETLATLKNMTSKTEPTTARMPTLEEIYTEFKGKNVRFFVEIKSYRTDIVAALKSLTERMDMLDQVSVITFERTGQIPIMRAQWPEMSVGCLIDANVVPLGSTTEGTVENVANLVQNYGSTFNPGCDYITVDYIRASNMRGITINPWTFRDQTLLDTFLLSGASSLTTDYPQWIKYYCKQLAVPSQSYTVGVDEMHEVKVTNVRYLGVEDVSKVAPLTILEGEDIVTVGEDNVLTFSKPGTVTYTATYTQHTNSGTNYTVYSEPVTITVAGAETGDVNFDGQINSKDVLALKMYVSGLVINIHEYASDINGDGAITTADAAALAQLIK